MATRMDAVEMTDGAAANARLTRGSTGKHRSESGRRQDGPSPRGPVSAGYIFDQRRRCQDTTGAKKVCVCAHGWWSQPQLQDKHNQYHLICTFGTDLVANDI